MNKKYIKIQIWVIMAILLGGLVAHAATNISSAPSNVRWAWNDVVGWLDFYITDAVYVRSDKIEGYGSSAVGYVSLDCATGPPGSDCAVPYGVANQGTGLLSGYAWNDSIGWISFNCADPGVCASSDYKVTIDADGNFSGFAWSEVAGWISFNCADPGSCGSSDYRVNTSWRTGPAVSGDLASSVFDTGIAGGAALQSLAWQGVLPAGTVVRFQIASSNSLVGPWTFVGPGSSGASYYAPAGPDIPVALDRDDHNNKRYFRYKVFLESNAAAPFVAPTVTDIIINWSP